MANGALLDYLRKPKTRQELKFKDQIDIGAQCADGMAYLEVNVSLVSLVPPKYILQKLLNYFPSLNL